MRPKDSGGRESDTESSDPVTDATLYQTDGGGCFPILLNVYSTTYIIEFHIWLSPKMENLWINTTLSWLPQGELMYYLTASFNMAISASKTLFAYRPN